MRVALGADVTIRSPEFTDTDEESVELDAAPSVTVTSALGRTLPAATATHEVNGVYKADLDHATHTAALDFLSITWTGTKGGKTLVQRDEHEVVSAHYVTIPAVRARPGIGDTPTTADIRQARDAFADIAERYRGVSFTPRLAIDLMRRRFDGKWIGSAGEWRFRCGGETVLLSHEPVTGLVAVTLDGVAQTVGDWSIVGLGSVPIVKYGKELIIAYTYGLDAPPPQLIDACYAYCEAVLKPETGMAPDSQWSTVDGAATRFPTPDWANGKPTGFVEVDRLLNAVPDYRIPGIA